ncbi:hypothetical protein A3D00_01130 [Candidatus Woesebacteria bacterium RIFCSPHIGHO2_02_FULL_38_9]|uniref:DUF5652 domain-containing protein n=1 Tax=Candidatus Woesebacteria bacterium RIFCSPHIGHO2_01_FULL_39_28 TaxID=1802496 RepID=A0A1F7YH09_9BACT|nr:MAG: hypothetical protein A2627_01265 [Candidatus Woesebacteria bacterium RIFCSPHIGHO2_01_FULL_39_28]OGM31726.1 MAG: hypothetical protein A3D00_01130 [Candidatus Woesebacteria bacterium RIFCSPHIGHO2_02_FULL_38_9]OGM57667.1 MAG: hypothetical protein A3A50_01505 [Candidatus Woesebacteria bacterium RIFCSPLOWO2_01_FULL_38_20]
MNLNDIGQISTPVIIILSVWEIVLKGITLWKSARKGQKYWFVFLLIVNSAGILPIIYLLYDKYYLGKKKKNLKK